MYTPDINTLYLPLVAMPSPFLSLFLSHFAIPAGLTRQMLLTRALTSFATIPYENLSKIVGFTEAGHSIHKQSPEDVVRGYITHGTGGTCFPLTQTLIQLLEEIGFRASPILADRRYGTDSHCALLCEVAPDSWHLIDPGYLLISPIALPTIGSAVYTLPFTRIELRRLAGSDRVELHTISSSTSGVTSKYRLTYKTTPVNHDTFHAAWDRSFEWEMMRYPVLSRIVDNTHIYVQKNSILFRTAESQTRREIAQEDFIREVSSSILVKQEVVKKALECLRRE